jgi:hypothetical protein
MTTRHAEEDTSTATLMANQSALVFAGLLLGGYDLGGEVAEVADVFEAGQVNRAAQFTAAGDQAASAERHRTAKSSAADELLTAA